MSRKPSDITGPATQLSLGFPQPAPEFDNLLVTGVNAAAIGIVRQVSHWPGPAVCLTGPPASGLTSILRAWAAETGGHYMLPTDVGALRTKQIAAMAGSALAIDDADRVSAADKLLAILEEARRVKGHVLLASHMMPSKWPVRSADLASRLASMTLAVVMSPDEETLKVRLEAAAARHFLKLPPDVVIYLAPRIDLSYEAIDGFAGKLSEAVSATGRAPSVPLAREVLEAMGLAAPGHS